MNQADYSEYQIQDFLEADFFIRWVIEPNEESNLFWQSFLTAYPSQQDAVDKAAGMIRLYRKQEFMGNEEQKELVWQRIVQSVEEATKNSSRPFLRMPVLLRVAAAMIITAGISYWLIYLTADKSHLITTAAGEIKTITLPDNSKVTLNGNSTLTYTDWDKETPREVWIKGEGYFDVKHLNKDTFRIKPSDRFIVHCDDVNIEVLGTTFNVKTRSGKTNVALLTGKIRIDDVIKSDTSKPLLLAPGDYVEYAGKKLITAKKLEKPTQIVLWTSDEISFTDAPLREVIETLEHRFGYKVTTEDTLLLDMKIEGDIAVDNVADLLDVVTTTLNIKIEQSANKHITITK